MAKRRHMTKVLMFDRKVRSALDSCETKFHSILTVVLAMFSIETSASRVKDKLGVLWVNCTSALAPVG